MGPRAPSTPSAPGELGGSLLPYGRLWFAYFATVGLFNSYAPLWFKALGMSTLAIGGMASLQAWTRVVSPYAWSWLADHKLPAGRLIRWSASGALLGAAGLAAGGLWRPEGWSATAWVALWMLVLFIANSGMVPLAESLLAQRLLQDAQSRRRAELQAADPPDTGAAPLEPAPVVMDAGRYARVRMWGSIGFIVSSFIVGWALEHLGIQAFAAAVVLGNLALWTVAARLPPAAEAAPHASAGKAPGAWQTLRQPRVAWFFASVFFTVMAHASLYAFFSLYLDHLGHGKAAVGMFWAVAVVCEVGFFLAQGRWLPDWPPERWLQVAAGVAVLRFALTGALGEWVAVLVLAQALHALTFAAHHVACIATVAQAFPGRLRSRGQALYSTLGYGLSGVVGGVCGGWLVTHGGFGLLFGAAAASAAVGGFCAWRMARVQAN